ncbi:glyoxysomal fatty acid beta-oxidation multifunctional protein MFP-a-like isoform X2 [Andrographis paniculata]|nr:glyoxysomal fatty acid beta-oxidation multifunctional protein MFP-a-like isoform X2 [Andrographis paniculata]
MSIQFLTDTLEAARKPFVAAIEGPAFGGGLEIALACHARISTPSAQLGLTELQYGILPGLGGTQRLPRLVGLPTALEMILMSKRVNGKEAQSLSLVDALAPGDKLLEVAQQWALDIVEGRRPWVVSLYKTDKLIPLEEARHMLNSARFEIQKQNPHVMHPLVCIDVIEEGIISDPRNALWKEVEALQELRQSSTCRSLIHVFFAQRQIMKVPGVPKKNLLPRKIVNVAVIGGGLMSSEIATMLVLSHYQVILKERNKENMLDDINRIKRNLSNYVKNGKATQEDLERAVVLLKGVLDYDNFEEVDLVIEVGSEDLSLKEGIFSDLEKFCNPHCIFASDSSTFSSILIGERTKSLGRLAQINFFCLSPLMPLMELNYMENTSPQVIADLIDFGRKLRKTPVVVSHCKRNAVNRVLVTYLHAAILLTEGGVDFYQIDRALESFGMKMGPFRLIDVVGFHAFAFTSQNIVEGLPDRSYKPKLIQFLLQNGHDGECNGKGFYKYDNCSNCIPDPELRKKTGNSRLNMLNATIDCKLRDLSDSEMVEMILFPAINEACQIISEGIITRSSDLDVASILGMGFPAFRGGIMYWSDSFCSSYIHSKLEGWSIEYGDFFKPYNSLAERSSKKISLVQERRWQPKSQM